MMWFRKEKPIVLTAITNRSDVYRNAQVTKMSKTLPSWFKNLPPESKDIFSTYKDLKGCTGFLNTFSSGFVIPMWCDLAIRTAAKGDNAYQYQFADNTGSAVCHSAVQCSGFFKEDEIQHLKIVTPWLMTCSEPIKFLLDGTGWWGIDKEYRVLDGVLDFEYQSGSNINIMIPRSDTVKDVMIPYGEPLARLLPLTERPVKLELKLVTDDEFNMYSRMNNDVTFNNAAQKKKRCPFNWKNNKE